MESASTAADPDGDAMDPRKSPPDYLKDIFKKSRKYDANDARLDYISWDEIILDNTLGVFKDFVNAYSGITTLSSADDGELIQSRAHRSTVIPGLMLLRNLLPQEVQKALVLRLLGRDLKNPEHRTNLHAHYDITYPKEEQTFFDLDKKDVNFKARLPIHRDLTMDEVFRRKLRWILLGGQYDWTEKRYPSTSPPPFPFDVQKLVRGIFPIMEPEAAIINVYSPGDTLSLHRDVSEKINRPLVSISLGCDALFIIGNNEPNAFHVIPLQSGDVVYMAGEARYAWHGVSRIIAGTCPEYLKQLSGAGHWEDLMNDKRINLNVRQMF